MFSNGEEQTPVGCTNDKITPFNCWYDHSFLFNYYWGVSEECHRHAVWEKCQGHWWLSMVILFEKLLGKWWLLC